MKTAKYVLASALGLIALVVPRAARADDIVEVNISNLTFTGLNACPAPSTPCTETANISFEWDNTTNSYVSGTITTSTSGVLGSLLLAAPATLTPAFLQPGSGTIPNDVTVELSDTGSYSANSLALSPFLEETGDALAVGVYPLLPHPSFSPGTFSAILLCSSSPCSSDYPFFGFDFNGNPFYGVGATAGTAVVSGVPEPSSMLLLGTGLVGMLGAVRRKLIS